MNLMQLPNEQNSKKKVSDEKQDDIQKQINKENEEKIRLVIKNRS